MYSLSFLPSMKPLILASQSNNSPLPPHINPKHSLKSINTKNVFENKPKQQKQKQKQTPSVAEIERVIGASVFRDKDSTNGSGEQNKTLFDSILSNSIGVSEGKVERKLRETGEWLIDGTEKASNSAGKNILLFVFLVLVPLWILSFLVASGTVKLPFNSPYFDDLIM